MSGLSICTVVRENGSNLSGGEKQRIYCARAMLRNCDVYIFDEAFTGMDATLSAEMIRYIEKTLADKIVIIISHDTSIIQRFDNIIVFEEDRHISCGSHQELLTKSENYQRIVEGDDE